MAGAGFNIAVLGEPELQRTLAALPVKFQKKVLRPAMRAGAKVVADASRREASTFTKSGGPAPHMADSIKVRAGKGRRGRGDVKVIVVTGTRDQLGIPVLTKKGEKRGYYPAALQYGWTPGINRRRLARTLRKGGASRTEASAAVAELGTRKIPPNPFMTRALESTRAAATAEVAHGIKNRIAELTSAKDASGNEATLSSEIAPGEVLA